MYLDIEKNINKYINELNSYSKVYDKTIERIKPCLRDKIIELNSKKIKLLTNKN